MMCRVFRSYAEISLKYHPMWQLIFVTHNKNFFKNNQLPDLLVYYAKQPKSHVQPQHTSQLC